MIIVAKIGSEHMSNDNQIIICVNCPETPPCLFPHHGKVGYVQFPCCNIAGTLYQQRSQLHSTSINNQTINHHTHTHTHSEGELVPEPMWILLNQETVRQ